MCEARGEYFKRAEVVGLFDRYDRWITRRLRAFVVKRLAQRTLVVAP